MGYGDDSKATWRKNYYQSLSLNSNVQRVNFSTEGGK